MADTDALVEEIARFEFMAKAYTDLVKEKKAELRAELEIVGEYAVGDFTVKLQPNRRFSPAKAKAILTEEEFEQVSERVAVGDLVKEHFPEQYEDMLNTFDHKVSVQPTNKED